MDKLAEKQAESASLARRMSKLRAAGSTESPYIINPYGYGGLQVEITDSKKKNFYYPYNISGYNCEVTAYNYNRFAYSSMVKGKYDAETNTYYIPDLGDDYDYYKNILKPQKVSTFMNTFTSFKYEDLERLGQFLEESVNVLEGFAELELRFDEMHWSDMKKTANFDISAQDDAIVLLFPRGNDYMMVYNIMQSIMKPIVKLISKKAAKMFDSDIFFPIICGKFINDPNYILEVKSAMFDPDLNSVEKIEKITTVSWNHLFKVINKVAWDEIDDGLKDALTDLIDESVLKAGSIEAASDWVRFKAAFKMLSWIKKYGDLLTGVLGTFFEDNAVYPIQWDANGQFVLDRDEVTVGEGESVNVRILVGNNLYHAETSDVEIATVAGAYNRIEIHGVDAGDAVITVTDKNAQKTAKINVHVTGIQSFVLAESTVSVPVYQDRSVTIERGDGPFHIFGGDEKIAVAKLIPKIFPGEKTKVVISGVSKGNTIIYVYNEATHQTLPIVVTVTAEEVAVTDDQFVDLGLSVKWANCNVGASEPQEYGDYFAWGEVETKESYSSNNYKYYSNGSFVDIGNDISGTKYDAATHNMGSDYRMPTKAEYEELISRCEWKFVTYRKVRGWKVTGPSGKSIFLPASGYMLYDWNENISIDGFYWSSNITDNNREVYTLFTTMHDYKMYSNHMNRFEGRTIRAVTKTEDNTVQTETFTVNGVSFNMVYVEGGTFIMGSPNDDSDAEDDEKPQHQVALYSFLIGQTEVTQELWEAVMGRNPSGNYKGAKNPVNNVSWNDCESFIEKLNQLTGLNFCLPTEAEWEYAARGGKKSKGYKYSGSDILEKVAWYNEGNNVGIHEVATKTPNELGIYDMTGNVSEWCEDRYNSNYYSLSVVNNPTGPFEYGAFRQNVYRGGCYYDDAVDLRVGNRYYSYAWSEYVDKGLRLALFYNGKSRYYSCPDDHHPHQIDLGLPSGTKWACCNVGATKPEENGGFYAWGETIEKSEYNIDNYSFYNNNDNTYIDIGEDIAGTDYDVAHVKWGINWCMPNNIQFQELLDCCEKEITQYMNKGWGMKFTGPNGNSLFFPPKDGLELESECIYWLSSKKDGYWTDIYINTCPYYYDNYGNNYGRISYESPYYGIPIRPVVR